MPGHERILPCFRNLSLLAQGPVNTQIPALRLRYTVFEQRGRLHRFLAQARTEHDGTRATRRLAREAIESTTSRWTTA